MRASKLMNTQLFEYQAVEIALRRGKAEVRRPNYLRTYAIRMGENMYLVTGGAIKLPLQHLMEHRFHTLKELERLGSVKDYLRDNGIFDED
ncbi:hypothetical protein SAMN05192529_1064 [Arachidicoccus rhizosphaerae]|uniref:Uncharacterized protein n=2 Tax=Arachidicoccus rhizosphaerae TaxID=551991 RepID=A0A1H3XPW7_9BACT|nr:hypothetical protein SAMN05192529_1064 [Arachidicoccus rhizosphaerae]